jgi:hypothetical protein
MESPDDVFAAKMAHGHDHVGYGCRTWDRCTETEDFGASEPRRVMLVGKIVDHERDGASRGERGDILEMQEIESVEMGSKRQVKAESFQGVLRYGVTFGFREMLGRYFVCAGVGDIKQILMFRVLTQAPQQAT